MKEFIFYLLRKKRQSRPDARTAHERISKAARSECKSWSFVVLESGSRCGRLQVVVTSEYVDGKGEVGVGKEAGRVERKSLSLVRLLLRGNKPRLRNDIFSHPSNKLHIQQIAGLLPNHRFPPAVSQKLHPVVLGYRDIIQEMFGFFFLNLRFSCCSCLICTLIHILMTALKSVTCLKN